MDTTEGASVRRSTLFLPPGYAENRSEALADEADVGTDDAGYWSSAAENRVRRVRRYQHAVYRIAAALPVPRGGLVLDVGCGTGLNLAEQFARLPVHTVGVDQAAAIAMARADFPDLEWVDADLRRDAVWEELTARRPALVICADVIEHLDDPVGLLRRLHRLVGDGRLVLSTPDRTRIEDQPPLGPPKNPHHVREWSSDEMAALLASQGFVVQSVRHVLPRRFGCTVLDAKIVAWRALHLRAVPARRSCAVFELTTS